MRYHLGKTVTHKLILKQEDFNRFAVLSGDDNPIHVDPALSAQTRFGKPVAHGMLLYSLICRVLGSQLPGPGSLQVSQQLVFPAPAYADEEITISLEVLRISSSHPATISPSQARIINSPGRFVELNTVITKADGSPACQGVTWMTFPVAWSNREGVGVAQATFQAARGLPLSSPLAAVASNREGAEATELKNLALGQSAEVTRTFTKADLQDYADLTGDKNPIYTDGAYAQRLGFQDAVIPGGLLGGLFSYLLGTRLPGPGTNWLKQSLQFFAPAYPGEEMTATAQIVRLRPEKDLINLRTVCTKSSGEVVCAGEALVLVRDI